MFDDCFKDSMKFNQIALNDPRMLDWNTLSCFPSFGFFGLPYPSYCWSLSLDSKRRQGL